MKDDTTAAPSNEPGKGPPEFAGDDRSADLTPCLRVLLDGRTLSTEQTTEAFEAMMTDRATHGEIGAFLALLAMRIPTPDEILGAARVMRAHVDRLPTTIPPDDLTDTAGTGGAPKTFNVSTAAAIVAAGAGARIVKHGNRSRTGRGSAELLRRLGVNIDADRDVQVACLEKANLCFCFAVHHHPATRHVMPVRQALGVPTLFNLLGPLTNPALARRQVMGVYARQFVEPIAEALVALGALRAMVVHSDDGLDELTITAGNTIAHVDPTGVRLEHVEPESLGFERIERDAVVARDLDHAVDIVRTVVQPGATGPFADMTLLTAAATLVSAGRCADLADGVDLARASVADGRAAAALEALCAISNRSR